MEIHTAIDGTQTAYWNGRLVPWIEVATRPKAQRKPLVEWLAEHKPPHKPAKDHTCVWSGVGPNPAPNPADPPGQGTFLL